MDVINLGLGDRIFMPKRKGSKHPSPASYRRLAFDVLTPRGPDGFG